MHGFKTLEKRVCAHSCVCVHSFTGEVSTDLLLQEDQDLLHVSLLQVLLRLDLPQGGLVWIRLHIRELQRGFYS